MFMFSQLIRGAACAVFLIFDSWAPLWEGGECVCFPFALLLVEGPEHLLVPTLGAGSVASIYQGFSLLPSLAACFLSPVPLLFLGRHRGAWGSSDCSVNTPCSPCSPLGAGILCLGHMGTWKKQQGCTEDLSQPVSSPSAQMQQRVSGWCLSISLLHLPGKAEWTSPALFSPGESENYSPQLRARQSESLSAWWEWAVEHIRGERGSGLLRSCISGRAKEPWDSGILALRLRADFQQQEHWVSVTGVGTCPSAPGSAVSFPVLAAKGTSNTSAYGTLLGHNGLHDLIILIGINWENNSLFQQE